MVYIDVKHSKSSVTHIYDKDGKEHFFKWIEVSQGCIVRGEEVWLDNNKTKYHEWSIGKPLQFDFFIDGVKNPLDVTER